MLGFDWSLPGNRIDVSIVMNNSNKAKEAGCSFWQRQDRVGLLGYCT